MWVHPLGREEEGEEEVLTSSFPSPPHFILGYPCNNMSKEIIEFVMSACQHVSNPLALLNCIC
jgi:hypothetical protein